MNREEITKTLQEIYPFLQESFKVKKIGIFGSFVREQQATESDIDILVSFHSPVGLEFFELQSFLEEKLDRKVDLVPIDSIKPEFQDEILGEVSYIEA